MKTSIIKYCLYGFVFLSLMQWAMTTRAMSADTSVGLHSTVAERSKKEQKLKARAQGNEQKSKKNEGQLSFLGKVKKFIKDHRTALTVGGVGVLSVAALGAGGWYYAHTYKLRPGIYCEFAMSKTDRMLIKSQGSRDGCTLEDTVFLTLQHIDGNPFPFIGYQLDNDLGYTLGEVISLKPSELSQFDYFTVLHCDKVNIALTRDQVTQFTALLQERLTQWNPDIGVGVKLQSDKPYYYAEYQGVTYIGLIAGFRAKWPERNKTFSYEQVGVVVPSHLGHSTKTLFLLTKDGSEIVLYTVPMSDLQQCTLLQKTVGGTQEVISHNMYFVEIEKTTFLLPGDIHNDTWKIKSAEE